MIPTFRLSRKGKIVFLLGIYGNSRMRFACGHYGGFLSLEKSGQSCDHEDSPLPRSEIVGILSPCEDIPICETDMKMDGLYVISSLEIVQSIFNTFSANYTGAATRRELISSL